MSRVFTEQSSPICTVCPAVTLSPGVQALTISTLELEVPALVWTVPLVLAPRAVSDRIAELAEGDTHPGPGTAELPGGAGDQGQAGAEGGAVQLV